MGKQHELLAVENDLRSAAQRETERLGKLFTRGIGAFTGLYRTYKPLNENGETFPPEVSKMSTTVEIEIETFSKTYGRFLDATIQKEVTNRKTHADVVVDGSVFLKDLPAPALLNLESRLAEIRKVYANVPTNDPTETWVYDDGEEAFVYAQTKYRTSKVPKTLVAYDATKEHPAQVQVYHEDERVGEWRTRNVSGMLPPARKREVLERIDTLLLAVKKARQRANDTEADTNEVSQKIFGYINA